MHFLKNGENFKDYFWSFFKCGVINIHNNKLVHDALNKIKEKHTF
jgi:hypothetical protein